MTSEICYFCVSRGLCMFLVALFIFSINIHVESSHKHVLSTAFGDSLFCRY